MLRDLLQFMRGGHDLYLREDADYRRRALAFTLNLAVPTALFFSPVNYFSGHQWLGLLLLVVGLVLMPVCLAKRKNHLLPLFEVMLMICATLIFGGLWMDGGIANTGIYWVFIYPFVAFYITGLRFGWLWVGGFITLMLAAFFAQREGFLALPYSRDELIYFGTSFLFYTLIACIFEYLRECWQSRLMIVNKRLEQEVADRKEAQEGRMQAEAQLLHGEKLKSLGVLAGGLAHDFNNLLSVIMGNAEMTRMDAKPSSAVSKSMIQIEGSCKRAAELCTQLLAFAGKGKINLSSVCLNDVSREITGLLSTKIPQGMQVKLHLTRDIPKVNVDLPQLHQVISGLILNASEAIGAGQAKGEDEGVITLTTGVMRANRQYLGESLTNEALPEGDYVFIEVSDTGCGIDVETVARIFDPFFTTKQYGRGMGLSAGLGIMLGHQGTIHVESEPAMGSSFRLLLPPVEEKPAAHASAVEDWNGSGLVLVVDDNDLVRKLSCRMLGKMGFETVAASNGKQAIKHFREKAGELVAVILDFSMSDMDGEEVFMALHDTRAEVPVILCSGFTKQDVLNRFRAQGLAGFLHKPYSRTQLQTTMRGVVEKH